MQLPTDLSTLNHALTKLPQVKIARAISLVILTYIAYLLAQITWQLFDNNPSFTSYSDNEIADNPSRQSSVDIDQLIALNLFGKVNVKPNQPAIDIENVPETKLNLTLSGVVASSSADAAAAVIENNGTQETYGIGDKITGTRARLNQVHADRVIIEQSGRKETLMLDGFDFKKPTKRKFSEPLLSNKAPAIESNENRVIDQRDNIDLALQAKNLKEDIITNPENIASYLSIMPKRVNNQIVGFDLKPGRDEAFFKASGLKYGDVAVQMNGLDLTDISQTQQALELLKIEQEISLLVERNGELTEILFSIENE